MIKFIFDVFTKKYTYAVLACVTLVFTAICYWFQNNVWLCAINLVIGVLFSLYSYSESRRTETKIAEVSNRLDETGLKIIDSDNYVFAITDQSNNMLFGIHRNGSVDWSKGVPLPIQDELRGLSKRIKKLETAS